MPRFIAATYHTKIKVAEFICDDGRHLLRCGGTLPWRLNNAGDLMSPLDENDQPAPKKTKNFIGFAAVPDKKSGKLNQAFIFPDYTTGREQLERSVRRLYSSRTLPQLVEKYAPPESNNSNKYASDLLRETGLSAEKTVGEMSDVEFKRVIDSIEKLEGYHNDAATRNEIWVPVSRITATDGARPLEDEEIILRVNDQERAVKTNEYGQLPPIPHPNGQQVDVLHRQPSGELKPVGTIAGDQGQHFSLKTWLKSFVISPGPDRAPDDSTPRREALVYIVEPNDSLSKLAKRFDTTVEQIKRDNGLQRDVIHPGQQLGINGPKPAGVSAAAVKRASTPNNPASKGKGGKPPSASQTAKPARSKAGKGKPIALLRADQRVAPWMTIAFHEATTFAGKDEKEITKAHNYHRLVTDKDRAGGEARVVKGKDGKPKLGKDGKAVTKAKFDGLPSLVGDHSPWCASFVNYCLREARYAPGRKHMSSYTFGTDKDLFVRIKEPIYGAIRFSKRDGGGHVCYVYGTAANKLVVIGGNQGDQICFELMNTGAKGEAFYIPFVYKDYATGDGANLPDIDIEALRNEFGSAVNITDDQIKSKNVKGQSQA
jgi:uncharacterized protein (TIGR02594 family)